MTRGVTSIFALPRLSSVSSYALQLATNDASPAKCSSVLGWTSPGLWWASFRGMRPENLDQHISRQSASLAQGAVELAINAIEAVTDNKVVGRYGEGRLQNLQHLLGDEQASFEVTTKAEGDVARQIRFQGLAGVTDDVSVATTKVSHIGFERGTEARLVKGLSFDVQQSIIRQLAAKLQYVQGATVVVNGEVINAQVGQTSLRETSQTATSGRIEITVNDNGYTVSDNGKGMTAETIVKRYLNIGNSEGEHQREYDDTVQPANLYFSAESQTGKKGRVSFLLCGVEIEGVEVEGNNLEAELGIEMGTGLARTEAADRVVLGRAEADRLKGLVKDVLAQPGEQKWAILNSLAAAINKVEWTNGEKAALDDWLFREVSQAVKQAEAENKQVFVPNEKAFEPLQTGKTKTYLNKGLFNFNPRAAGLVEHSNYDSRDGYQLYLAEFKNDEVYVEVGKTIVLNQAYAGNVLLVNLLFNFWVGYGPKVKGKVRLKLPWETLAEARPIAAQANAATTGQVEGAGVAHLSTATSAAENVPGTVQIDTLRDRMLQWLRQDESEPQTETEARLARLEERLAQVSEQYQLPLDLIRVAIQGRFLTTGTLKPLFVGEKVFLLNENGLNSTIYELQKNGEVKKLSSFDQPLQKTQRQETRVCEKNGRYFLIGKRDEHNVIEELLSDGRVKLVTDSLPQDEKLHLVRVGDRIFVTDSDSFRITAKNKKNRAYGEITAMGEFVDLASREIIVGSEVVISEQQGGGGTTYGELINETETVTISPSTAPGQSLRIVDRPNGDRVFIFRPTQSAADPALQVLALEEWDRERRRKHFICELDWTKRVWDVTKISGEEEAPLILSGIRNGKRVLIDATEPGNAQIIGEGFDESGDVIAHAGRAYLTAQRNGKWQVIDVSQRGRYEVVLDDLTEAPHIEDENERIFLSGQRGNRCELVEIRATGLVTIGNYEMPKVGWPTIQCINGHYLLSNSKNGQGFVEEIMPDGSKKLILDGYDKAPWFEDEHIEKGLFISGIKNGICILVEINHSDSSVTELCRDIPENHEFYERAGRRFVSWNDKSPDHKGRLVVAEIIRPHLLKQILSLDPVAGSGRASPHKTANFSFYPLVWSGGPAEYTLNEIANHGERILISVENQNQTSIYQVPKEGKSTFLEGEPVFLNGVNRWFFEVPATSITEFGQNEGEDYELKWGDTSELVFPDSVRFVPVAGRALLTCIRGDKNVLAEVIGQGLVRMIDDDAGLDPKIEEHNGRIFVYLTNGRVGSELLVSETGELDVYPIYHLTSGSNIVRVPGQLGQNFSQPLPAEALPARTSFADRNAKKRYEWRRRQMMARLARGDFDSRYNLELAAYMGTEVLAALGERTIAQIEQRIADQDFRLVDLYLNFINLVWVRSNGAIKPELFQQVVERWGLLLDIFENDVGELRDLLGLFMNENFYPFLFDGRELERSDEIGPWINFFREPNLEGVVERRESQAVRSTGRVLAEVGEHDLSLYLWASRKKAGWEKKPASYHARLAAHFSERNIAPAQNRLRGIITGQKLEKLAYANELAQNSRDAGSERLEITSYVQEREGFSSHVSEYQDYGQGMTGAQVKAQLLNIEASEKEAEKKADGQAMTGKNGIGFKSILAEADRAKVRTSTGNGVIVEVDLRCVRDGKKLVKVVVESYREVEGQMQGTWIQVEQELGETSEQSTKLKEALTELMYQRRLRQHLGLVRGMSVTLNGRDISEEISQVESRAIDGRGTYSLLEVARRPDRVVHTGLWVNNKKDRYLKYLPELLRDYLRNSVLEIGADEELTRGRGEVMASTEEVGKIAFVLALQKAVKYHLGNKKRIMAIPQDLLYGQELLYGNGDLEGDLEEQVRRDAARINHGSILDIDLGKYLANDQALVQLMTLVEVAGDDGIALSLMDLRAEARAIVHDGAEPRLSQSCLLGEGMQDEFAVATAKRTSYAREDRTRTPIEEHDDNLRNYLSLVEQALAAIELSHFDTGFYSGPGENRLAVFHQGGLRGLFFRQEAINWAEFAELYQQLEAGQISPETYQWWSHFLETPLVHESVHSKLGQQEGWTHGADPKTDDSFAKHMHDTFITMIQSGYNPFAGRLAEANPGAN
ncbi:MAG: ATP-binding protein [bacterium]